MCKYKITFGIEIIQIGLFIKKIIFIDLYIKRMIEYL